MSDDRPERVFVLAEENLKQECFEKAERWHSEKNQHMFESGEGSLAAIAIAAVAEYIANEKGFTSYERNAKYPKDLKNVS